MANEFRIKHGLIVTGSSYFSESMFAPNLPEETSPQYYITWRQSDGRFEVSTGTNSVQDTIACWDYASGDPNSGEWNTNNGSVGSSVTFINIHKIDNNSVDQSNLLKALGPGSVIILYVGSSSTTFTVQGSTFDSSLNTFSLSVSYISGDEYSITGTPEMCLAIGATVSSNTSTSINCLEYQMSNSATSPGSTSGLGVFDRVVSSTHWQTPLGTVNGNVEGLLLNKTDLNGAQGFSFLNNFYGEIEIGYGQYATKFKCNPPGPYNSSNSIIFVPVIYVSGDSNYTIATGDSFTLCKSSR
jgi:hypothetical protein